MQSVGSRRLEELDESNCNRTNSSAPYQVSLSFYFNTTEAMGLIPYIQLLVMALPDFDPDSPMRACSSLSWSMPQSMIPPPLAPSPPPSPPAPPPASPPLWQKMSHEDHSAIFARRQAAVRTQARAALESALLADEMTPVITMVVTPVTVFSIDSSFPLAEATIVSFGASEREAFRTGLATMLGVPASDVTITIAVSAGSVLVTAVVTASSANMQQALATTLR